jgi:hypothetical protein
MSCESFNYVCVYTGRKKINSWSVRRSQSIIAIIVQQLGLHFVHVGRKAKHLIPVAHPRNSPRHRAVERSITREAV